MKKMIIIEENEEYILSGKTGWSIRNGKNNSWFVGYIESRNNVYFFATNIKPKEQFDMNLFPMVRKDLTYKALKQMNVLK